MTKKQLRRKVKQVCIAKGESMKAMAMEKDDKKLQKKAQKLLDAKLSGNYMRRNFDSPRNANPKSKQRYKKVSNLSIERSKAKNNPQNVNMMLEKQLEMYDDHYKNGKLKTPYPTRKQMWNWDEIGFDPNGRCSKLYTLGYDNHLRRYRETTGDKPPFLATLLYATNADGDIAVHPTLVHQSMSKDDTMPGNLVWGLGDDFLLCSSNSGYIDEEAFYHSASQLVKDTKVNDSNPIYLFQDGFYAHFDVDAIDVLHEHNIHTTFLCSNNSIQDQPQDNGPNAKLKSLYNDDKYQTWREQHPGVPYTKAFFNTVIQDTWNDFVHDSSTRGCIRKSFEKTGLYNPSLEPKSVPVAAAYTQQQNISTISSTSSSTSPVKNKLSDFDELVALCNSMRSGEKVKQFLLEVKDPNSEYVRVKLLTQELLRDRSTLLPDQLQVMLKLMTANYFPMDFNATTGSAKVNRADLVMQNVAVNVEKTPIKPANKPSSSSSTASEQPSSKPALKLTARQPLNKSKNGQTSSTSSSQPSQPPSIQPAAFSSYAQQPQQQPQPQHKKGGNSQQHLSRDHSNVTMDIIESAEDDKVNLAFSFNNNSIANEPTAAYNLCISKAAHHYLQTSFVQPAKQIETVLNNQKVYKAAKVAKKVKPKKKGRRYPNTRQGLLYSKEIHAEVKKITVEREQEHNLISNELRERMLR